MNANSLSEWGIVMKLDRRASALAIDDLKARGKITDPLAVDIMLYTDDPTTAVLFAANPDMAEICKCSRIENVATVMGEDFPPSAFEAEREDKEYPRVAALGFRASSHKCPRCWKRTASEERSLCARCASILGAAV